jgi:hypothetical protein
MTDWQPIETAPKDNIRVITFGRGLVGTVRRRPLVQCLYSLRSA